MSETTNTCTIPQLSPINNITDDIMFIVSDNNGDYRATAEQIGDYLITKFPSLVTPNLAGQFAPDSTPDDWFWFPDGVKTPLPVDPATRRFSLRWPSVISSAQYLFAGGSPENAYVNTSLVALDELPPVANVFNMLRNLEALRSYPVIDCSAIAPQGRWSDCYYVILSSRAPSAIFFNATAAVTTFEMALNFQGEPVSVYGIDADSAVSIQNMPFGNGFPRLELRNLGAAPDLSVADLRSSRWGDDSSCPGARQSLVDVLLNWSADRAALGYPPCTVRLSTLSFSLLSDAERSAIAAKGFSLTSESL